MQLHLSLPLQFHLNLPLYLHMHLPLHLIMHPYLEVTEDSFTLVLESEGSAVVQCVELRTGRTLHREGWGNRYSFTRLQVLSCVL